MAKKLFDNVMKVFKARSVINTSTIVSLEIDLDLPRGYIAKIHDVEIGTERIGEDFEADNPDKLATIQAALIKDPDDTTSIEIPEERTDHDVLIDYVNEVLIAAGAANSTSNLTNLIKNYNFSAEGLDVFSARNMRLNCVGVGTSVADLTEALVYCTLHYTLELISDDDIINLLDIL